MGSSNVGVTEDAGELLRLLESPTVYPDSYQVSYFNGTGRAVYLIEPFGGVRRINPDPNVTKAGKLYIRIRAETNHYGRLDTSNQYDPQTGAPIHDEYVVRKENYNPARSGEFKDLVYTITTEQIENDGKGPFFHIETCATISFQNLILSDAVLHYSGAKRKDALCDTYLDNALKITYTAILNTKSMSQQFWMAIDGNIVEVPSEVDNNLPEGIYICYISGNGKLEKAYYTFKDAKASIGLFDNRKDAVRYGDSSVYIEHRRALESRAIDKEVETHLKQIEHEHVVAKHKMEMTSISAKTSGEMTKLFVPLTVAVATGVTIYMKKG